MRIITVAYYALVPNGSELQARTKAGDDARQAEWFPFKNLPRDIAFDHRTILNDLRDRLKGKISYTPIAFSLIPKKFTWGELQGVHETILGESVTKANFRRKIRGRYKIKEHNRNIGQKHPGPKAVYLTCGGTKG